MAYQHYKYIAKNLNQWLKKLGLAEYKDLIRNHNLWFDIYDYPEVDQRLKTFQQKFAELTGLIGLYPYYNLDEEKTIWIICIYPGDQSALTHYKKYFKQEWLF